MTMGTELLRCIVTGFDDPDGQCRIGVRPLEDADGDGEDDTATPGATAFWVRIASPQAGKFTGMVLAPALGDEVLVARSSGDGAAYLLGSLWSALNPAPLAFSGDAPPVWLETRHGTRIMVDGASPGVELSTASGQRVRIEDAPGRVSITDHHGNEVVLSSDGIALSSGGRVAVQALAQADVSAARIELEATSLLELKASVVKIDGVVMINGRHVP